MPSSLFDFGTLGFGEPVYLWLLVVPALLMVLWAWQVARRRADTRRFAQSRVLPVRERYTAFGDLAFWLALLLAVSLCIVALAMPRARISVLRKEAAADFVLLQDGSASMYVTDILPSRWQRSVQFIRTFAQTLTWKGDRVALCLFAQLAAPQLRLTKDPNALFFFIDHLGTQSPFRLEDNPTWDTNIEEGVYWGLKIVQQDEQLFGKSKNPKGFVVISDGQAWSGNVATSLASARRSSIPVYVVGVGTANGGLIPEPRAPDGTTPPPTIMAKLDRESLITIAKAGGGEYYELGREPDRDIAINIHAAVRRRAPPVSVEQSYEELYWVCLLAAALVLCAGILILKAPAELWAGAVGAVATILFLVTLFR